MKKSELKVMIRKIVREEVAMSIKEVIEEITKPTKNMKVPVTKKNVKKAAEKKQYTKNSVLNEVINETAGSEEWKKMGEKTYTSDDMNDVLAKSYGDMMGDNSNGNLVAEMGVDPNNAPDFLTKDYRAVMKKIDEKQGNK